MLGKRTKWLVGGTDDGFIVKWNICFIVFNTALVYYNFTVESFSWRNAVAALLCSIVAIFHVHNVLAVVKRWQQRYWDAFEARKVRIQDGSNLHTPKKPNYVDSRRIQDEIENAIRLAIAMGQEHKAQQLLAQFAVDMTAAEAKLYQELYEITHHEVSA